MLRPTTAADVASFFPEPLPFRIQATTAELDGEILGIGGVGFRPDGTFVAFVRMSDAARRYPSAIHRAGLHAVAMMRSLELPLVVAEAQPDNPAACRWLERLGFRRWSGKDFYVWRAGTRLSPAAENTLRTMARARTDNHAS